jgi:polyferredoxin
MGDTCMLRREKRKNIRRKRTKKRNKRIKIIILGMIIILFIAVAVSSNIKNSPSNQMFKILSNKLKNTNIVKIYKK